MSGHTPGPWVLDHENDSIRSEATGELLFDELDTTAPDVVLLAAAPDLLAALKHLVTLTDAKCDVSALKEWIRTTATPTIAKAEGRS